MRTLVVDDDAGIRAILRELLEEEGYTVSVASDGEEGLRAILARAEPLVVLLDLLMPALSGEETLAAALEHQQGETSANAQPPVAFILITANPRNTLPLSLVNMTRAHGIPIERKPFDTERLLDAIARAAARVHATAS